MKKIFTLFAAFVLSAMAAFAQEVSQYLTVTPAPGSELTTLTPTFKVVIDDEIKAGSMFIIQTVGGSGFAMYSPEMPDFLPVEEVEGEDRYVEFTIPAERWSTPFNEVYYLQVIAVLADEEGTPIEDPDGEYVMAMVNYTCPDNAPAAWAKNYPSERNFTEEGLTFARFYNVGECVFYFTKPVTLPEETMGNIVYRGFTGRPLTVSIPTSTVMYDEEMGLYAVSVDVRNSRYTADDLQSIEVTLSGVSNGTSVIAVPAISVVNSTTPQAAPRKSKAIETELVSGTDEVNIYNVQGMLVKEHASATAVNELPAGLYIVNGKKVIVR